MRNKIRQLRLEKGISQAFISKKLGFSHASGYGNIEMGRNRLSLEHAAIIADILGVPVDDLLDDEKKFQNKLHGKSRTTA